MSIDPTTLAAFRWMPGMLACCGRGRLRVIRVGGGQLWGLRMGGESVWSDDGLTVDPSDPATLGCLLQMVREAWGLPHAYLYRDAGGWLVADGDGYPDECNDLGDDHGCTHSTEFDALVAALAAAPKDR